MAAAFVVVPQWQASGSSRAMRLVDGAEAIRGDLPAASTVTVEIPLEAGDELGTGVSRAGSLRLVHDRTLEVLETRLGSPIITIGGDCGVSLAAIGHANAKAGGDLAVVWLDAHPDLNTSASSPSGCFNGMVLRSLTGDGVEGLVPSLPVTPANIVLAGTRSFDDGEDEYVRANGLTAVGIDQLATPEALLAAIEATGASAVYLHIDVDVLDPGEINGLSDPVPFGLPAAKLVELVRAITSRFTVVGATIAEFAPASPEAATDDLPTLLRVIGALTS